MTTPVEHPTSSQEYLPYIVDIIPHLKSGDNSPTDVVRAFMKTWAAPTKPHILGDSAFGSFDLLKEIVDWGGGGTFAMQGKFAPHLWEVLSVNLPPNTWSAAYNDRGWTASCSMIFDEPSQKQTYQQILSTAFRATPTTSPIASGPASAADTIVPPVSHSMPSKTTMPIYERGPLTQLTVAQLREICAKENIKRGKTKAALIDNILARSATVHQEYERVESIKRRVLTDHLPIPGPAHQFYRAFFNLIDLADKKWNAVADHHGNQHWKSKMLLAILRFALLNAWTYATKIKYSSWLDWRRELALSILGLTAKP